MDAKRKEKTLAMKNMLQMQIDLQNKVKDEKAEEKRAIAHKIAQDQADYEKDQMQKRQDQLAKNQAN